MREDGANLIREDRFTITTPVARLLRHEFSVVLGYFVQRTTLCQRAQSRQRFSSQNRPIGKKSLEPFFGGRIIVVALGRCASVIWFDFTDARQLDRCSVSQTLVLRELPCLPLAGRISWDF